MKNEQRVAVVTGANRGLGLGTARELARRGYRVILTARDETAGKKALDGLTGDVHFHRLDVTSDVEIELLRAYVERQFGAVDVLVNNAGVTMDDGETVLTVGPEAIDTTLAINLRGPWRLAQAFMPGMIAQNYGRVVNVSSGMGESAGLQQHSSTYRLSKYALNGLTRMLADAAGDRDVLVNAVCPGWVRTDMGGPNATRALETGVGSIVWAVTLPTGGPSGGFFRDGNELAW